MKTIAQASLTCIAILYFAAAATFAQNSPCSCSDIRDLLNRVNEAHAAINEYKNQIEIIREREKTDGERMKFTVRRYKEVMQPIIQAAINQVTDSGARKATAETNELSCETQINSPTECLRKVIDFHEGVHRSACPARRNPITEVFMTDFAQEEINAYTAEINYIISIILSLPRLCRPEPWFGTINTTRTGTTLVSKGKTRTVNDTGNWILLLTQGAPSFQIPSVPGNPAAEKAMREALAKMQAQMAKNKIGLFVVTDVDAKIDRKTKWKGGGNECCGSDAGVSPDIDMTETEAGRGHQVAKVTVNFIAGRLMISFSHDAITGTRTTDEDVIRSDCPADKDNKESEDVQLTLSVPQLETNASLELIGGMEVLRGNKTVPVGTETVKYEWNLRRFPK